MNLKAQNSRYIPGVRKKRTTIQKRLPLQPSRPVNKPSGGSFISKTAAPTPEFWAKVYYLAKFRRKLDENERNHCQQLSTFRLSNPLRRHLITMLFRSFLSTPPTRIHSSRMRAGRSLTVSRSLLPGGWGGVLSPGGRGCVCVLSPGGVLSPVGCT